MAVKMFRYLLTYKKPIVNFHYRKNSKTYAFSLNPELQESFNNQINMEIFAGYTYLAMAAFFGRQNVALQGCYKFCMDQVKEEQEHARKLINYVNQRGSNVQLDVIESPSHLEWANPVCAFKDALDLEVKVTQKLLQLRKVADDCCDISACNWIEDNFLEDQMTSMDKISRHITVIERMGLNGLALQIFDQHLLQEYDSKT